MRRRERWEGEWLGREAGAAELRKIPQDELLNSGSLPCEQTHSELPSSLTNWVRT